MRQIVISTIGTSLLTNQIDRKNPDEETWYTQLRDTANLRADQIPPSVTDIVTTLKQRALSALEQSPIARIRQASAELNGIYGLYQGDLDTGKQDWHYLLATDTIQGQTTAEVVKTFLQHKGLSQTEVVTPPGLSTASTQDFAAGIDELIVWLRQTLTPLRSQAQICFNLVGSFKSLQGYMNTIGMFYADKIIYIFEGQGSELITIPRLPIQVDIQLLEPHAVRLAMMDEGAGFSEAEVIGIPESMLGDFANHKVLSTWGKLIWDEAKQQLLSQKLLSFPALQYADTFREDYKKEKEPQKRVALQSDLAKVAYLLQTANGDTSALFQPLDYTRYKNSDEIDHFRVNRSLRVSCCKKTGGLQLRYYGTHDHVERAEKLR
jgi:putative CRISPR-associated protein (TIGR02619 family)